FGTRCALHFEFAGLQPKHSKVLRGWHLGTQYRSSPSPVVPGSWQDNLGGESADRGHAQSVGCLVEPQLSKSNSNPIAASTSSAIRQPPQIARSSECLR